LLLSCTHSILYYGHTTFDSHRLLQEYSWGIKQGLGIVTCNTEDLVMIDLVCVFLEVFLTALYFRALEAVQRDWSTEGELLTVCAYLNIFLLLGS